MNMMKTEEKTTMPFPGLYDEQGHLSCSFMQLELTERIHFGQEGIYCRDRDIEGKLVVPDYVKEISPWAFFGCRKLTEIQLPESITTIGQEAFYMCVSLKKINIPDMVTEIPFAAFCYCQSLTSLKLPAYLNRIDLRALDGCHSLSRLKFPKDLKEIDKLAFYYCDHLKKIWLPDSLKKLETDAFDHCEGLRIASVSSDTDIKKNAFPPHTLIEIRNSETGSVSQIVAEESEYMEV